MNKKKKRILAGILSLVMSLSVIPATAFAKGPAVNGIVSGNVTLSQNQSITYNKATLFNYSDSFYNGSTKHNDNLIQGKEDYNEELLRWEAENNPSADKWEGIYFNLGNPAGTVGIKVQDGANIPTSTASPSSELQPGRGNAFDGNYTDKAWTTWTSTGNTTGWYQFAWTRTNTVRSIDIYLNMKDGNTDLNIFPTQIQVTDGNRTTYATVSNLNSGSFTLVDAEKRIYKYTIVFDRDRSNTTFRIIFTHARGYVMLSELVPKDEFGNPVVTPEKTLTKQFANHNFWPGNKLTTDYRAWVYSGLAKDTLTNGQILFNVPENGLFTLDDSNKEVYQNVGIPFVYDSSTGYYTFNAAEYGVHFDDTNNNGTIDAAEKKSNTNLVLDHTFTGIDNLNNNNKVGFYPFNCYGGNRGSSLPPSQEESTVYHFGLSTSIPFTMTEYGTIDNTPDGTPLEFTFAGDDDVWVYIDGVLVLDLGGIHDSVTGKIDFKNNYITMYATNTSQTCGDWNSEAVNPSLPGNAIDIGQIFNTEEREGVLAKTQEKFASEGEHTLNIFYLERGRGESNCLIQYNLPRKDALEVTKNIQLAPGENPEITEDEWKALNELEFTMRVKNEDNEPVTGKYALYESSVFVGMRETDAQGYFKLKNHQTARFTGVLGNSYVVEEVATEQELPAAVWGYADWKASYTTVNGNGNGNGNVQTIAPKKTENDDTKATESLSYEIDISTAGSNNGTLLVDCTNYIKRPFVSVSPETVVIDYGLPVMIDIMKNDVQSSGKEFIINKLTSPRFGTVKVVDKEGNEITSDIYTRNAGYYYLEYTPNTYLSSIETISYTYEVQNMKDGVPVLEYPMSTATVIPATSMYYEENFLNKDGKNYIKFSTANGYQKFENIGSADKIYQEPGEVGTINDSTYGTDAAYLKGSSDSNGTSFKADTTDGPAAFQYTFTGTGTAFFARTSAASAYLRIKITDSSNESIFTTEDGADKNGNIYIDTKYAVTDGTELYNIPVYNIEDLDYGTYTVTVTAAKPAQWYQDQNEFYLDGVRVYNPLQLYDTDGNLTDEGKTALEAYKTDMEADVKVLTLRDYMLDTQTDENGEWSQDGQVMFTDTNGEITNASDYESIGPKQELYMVDDQKISFVITGWNNDRDKAKSRLYIGAKVPNGGEGSFKVNSTEYKIENTTDCYYDITSAVEAVGGKDGYAVITIENGLISFTNLKCTGFPGFSFANPDTEVDINGDGRADMTVYSFLSCALEGNIPELPVKADNPNKGKENNSGKGQSKEDNPNKGKENNNGKGNK